MTVGTAPALRVCREQVCQQGAASRRVNDRVQLHPSIIAEGNIDPVTEHRDASESEFVVLLTQHQRNLLSYILTLIPLWSDAEDLLQKTNVRLWEERSRFVPGTSFSAWATRVAYYEVLSWRKTATRSKLVFDTELVGELARMARRIPEESRSRRAVALAECLRALPDGKRELLRQCYGEQRKAADLAAKSGKSVVAIYKAIQRLRTALCRCVEMKLAEENA